MSKGCVTYSEFKPTKEIGRNEGDLCLAMEGIQMELSNWMREKDLEKKFRIFLSNNISIDEIFRFRNMRCADYFRSIKKKNEGLVTVDKSYDDNFMIPDGGILWLEIRGTNERYPILISEMKTQGTNEGRRNQGLDDQACGNAIERLGKYVLAFAMLYEFDAPIFPFVSFSCGCDFDFDEEGRPNTKSAKVQGGKLISMLGGMAGFNRIITSKTMPTYMHFKPNTSLARKDPWSTVEMKNILREVAFDSLTYYLTEISKKPKKRIGVLKIKK